MEQTSSMQEILLAREQRMYMQRQFLKNNKVPLISFSMNIAGPVKNSPLIRQGFAIGRRRILACLAGENISCLQEAELSSPTGDVCFVSADTDSLYLKQLMIRLEDQDALGRLFDIDVIPPFTEDDASALLPRISREDLGLPPRRCLLCGKPSRNCTLRRVHPLDDIRRKTNSILRTAIAEEVCSSVAALAVRALLYEVNTTPKPGLVDRNNCGSHKDMNTFTFLNSAAALWPYFHQCAKTGYYSTETGSAPAEVFSSLRKHGRAAELTMYHATGGVNTHKGAVFSLGIICAAAARALHQNPDTSSS